MLVERPNGVSEPDTSEGRTIKYVRNVPRLASLLMPSRELSVIALPTAVFVVLLSFANPSFLSSYNLNSVLASVAVIALVGLSQVVLFAIGQFNLAVAGMGAASGMMLGWLLQVVGLPIPLAVAAALCTAAGFGFLQGALISRTNLNPFIVTLGLASVLTGVVAFLTHGHSFDHLPPLNGQIGNATIGPVPVILVASLAVCALVAILLHGTVYGRELLATGANPRAAVSTGIPTGRVVLLAHVLSGVLVGIAAVLTVARLATAPVALGEDWLLPSFAVPVLGGSLIQGGRVSVSGAVMGATFLAVIANGLLLVGVSQYWYQTGTGIVILVAVMSGRIRVPAVRRPSIMARPS